VIEVYYLYVRNYFALFSFWLWKLCISKPCVSKCF